MTTDNLSESERAKQYKALRKPLIWSWVGTMWSAVWMAGFGHFALHEQENNDMTFAYIWVMFMAINALNLCVSARNVIAFQKRRDELK